LTLEFLNRATQAWIEMEYNRCFHQEIKQSPLQCFLNKQNVSRRSPENQMMHLAFTVQERRSQRRSDGTISIKNKRFEIPSRFRHLRRPHIRYQSWDLSSAYLVDERSGNMLARIYPQDKIKNAQGYRRALQPIAEDTPTASQTESDPLPPLLRKLISEYAATGLPPAYIPKQESMLSTIDQLKEEEDE
jgi:hypothetical protein